MLSRQASDLNKVNKGCWHCWDQPNYHVGIFFFFLCTTVPNYLSHFFNLSHLSCESCHPQRCLLLLKSLVEGPVPWWILPMGALLRSIVSSLLG